MARTTIETQIGDCTYQITHLANGPARRVLRRLLAAAAPLASAQVDDLGGVLQRVMASIDDADLDEITACFAAESKIRTPLSGGVFMPLSSVIDDHFAGARLGEFVQWVKACADHNFAGFFVGLRAHVGERGPSAEQPSPSTSTGGSTE